ncbi:MAG TPA: GntR family transcriptional regulator [Pyrinomonadaceae bacterium]|jgi:GntR family transcriptional regulator
MELNRNGNLPLHIQIHEYLRQSIDSKELKAGDAVGSERELAERFNVSRMTVRQALRTLRQEGLIYQERGVGTFVARRKLDVHTRNLGGFTEEMQRRGFEPRSKVLQLRREAASAPVAESLGIEVDSEVFRLERLRLVNNVPMAHEVAFLPVKLCPELDNFDFETVSLYEVLGKHFSVEIDHAEEVLEAECAAPPLAQLLGVKTNAPLLVVNRVVFTALNRAVEAVRTIYRADRYRATFFLSKTNL